MSDTQTQEAQQAQTVVTSENLLDFQLGKMGIKDEPVEQKSVEQNTDEDHKEEPSNTEQPVQTDNNNEEEIPPDGTMEGGKVVFRGKWVDKKDVGYRMHLKTEAVKAEKARADAMEARVRELEALTKKDEPKKLSEKPAPENFTDLNDYAEALEKWGREQALAEYEKTQKENQLKEQQERVMNAWNKQLETTRKEIEDFDEVLNDSPVTNKDFSPEVQAAIVESEVGARLLYHFAQNPDVVEKLKGMTLTGALREVGKIEAKLEKAADKDEKPVNTKTVQKSSAPAPIRPVGSSPSGTKTDGYFDENGEFTGTIAEYKQLRREGKIK